MSKYLPDGRIERRDLRWGLSFVLPAMIFFAVFFFYPIGNAFWTSFLDKDPLSLGPAEFVGLENYISIFNSGPFWNSLTATAIFGGGTTILFVVVSFFIALAITSTKRFQSFLEMTYFSPAVVSSVVAASIWMLVLSPRGIANQWINALLGTPGQTHGWLSSGNMLRLSTILVYFWKYVGFFTILYISGLSSIPKSVYESAEIDGANAWQRMIYVTLPLIKPTIVMVSILATIRSFRTFSVQYFFTQSGMPRGPINVIALNIYHKAIRQHNLGEGTAMSMILLAIMVTLSLVQLRVGGQGDELNY